VSARQVDALVSRAATLAIGSQRVVSGCDVLGSHEKLGTAAEGQSGVQPTGIIDSDAARDPDGVECGHRDVSFELTRVGAQDHDSLSGGQGLRLGQRDDEVDVAVGAAG
jgi:hypothetical protein